MDLLHESSDTHDGWAHAIDDTGTEFGGGTGTPQDPRNRRADRGNAASEKLDQIQCRFVGPMDVLKDHNRRSLPLAKAAHEE